MVVPLTEMGHSWGKELTGLCRRVKREVFVSHQVPAEFISTVSFRAPLPPSSHSAALEIVQCLKHAKLLLASEPSHMLFPLQELRMTSLCHPSGLS